MTARLKIKGDGSCCECGNMDGCECRKCSKLECRSRGGTVNLCGFQEYDVPANATRDWLADPPRYYRRRTLSGDTLLCNCPVSDCVTGDAKPVATAAYEWKISDELTCAYSATAAISGVYYDSGLGQIRYTITWTGGTASGPCAATAEGRTQGVLTYFGSGGAITAHTRNADGGGLCPGASVGTNSPTQVSASIQINGAGTGAADSAYVCVCVDHQAESTRLEYSGMVEIDPAIHCSTPAISTGKRKSTTWLGLVCGGGEELSKVTQDVAEALDPFDTFLNSYLTVNTVTPTIKRQDTPFECNPPTVNLVGVSGSFRQDSLSLEDTEEAGITRLMAGSAGTWSAWQLVLDGTNGTCINPACCRAAWQPRVERFFEYREAEFRATIEPLPAGTAVTIKISVFRKPWSAPTYDLFQTLEYDVTANAAGKAIVEGTVPNARGFETYVACTYTPPTP